MILLTYHFMVLFIICRYLYMLYRVVEMRGYLYEIQNIILLLLVKEGMK